MRFPCGLVLIAIVLTSLSVPASEPEPTPHDDPDTGVLRVLTTPSTRGQCTQCHPTHDEPVGPGSAAPILFTENSNRLPFWNEGASPCHPERPSNYPLQEDDRLPGIDPDAGYFEANDGGVRRVGVQFRGRWPGRAVYASSVVADGHFISPHAQDPDMPRKDAGGEGLCLNCHDPHGDLGHNDLLRHTYRGIGGGGTSGPPSEYDACFTCHGSDGPGGMEIENRLIEDFYDSSLNGYTAGHQVRRNPRVALSWPAHVQTGDKLPCYDCHNPHGSIGYNGVQPNAFVLSDQRTDWSGLTRTLTDAAHSRRFCLGCHIPSDGVPGTQVVEGIVMNTISDRDAHRLDSTESCHDCHGRDYGDPTGHNVHNPLAEPDSLFGPDGW